MRVLAFVALAGCGFSHGGLQRDDATAGDDARDAALDAMPDAMPDAGPNLGSCNTAGLNCFGGTAVAMTCNNECWVKCTTVSALIQSVARTSCTNWGGRLAPIDVQADNDCVAITLFPAQASWIGLEQDSSATTLAGGWTWNGDGVAISYTNWDSGQPNDQNGGENGQEQCAYIPTDGKWQDADCFGQLYRFSCRRP